jgi:sugar phosphate isomerase/epimerase
MFNLTVRGHDLTGHFSIETLPPKIKAMGISNVQLALPISFPELPSQPENLSPGYGTYVKNEFANSDIQIAILSCYINIIHPDLAIRETLLQKFESYVKHAKYFGASMVATETGNVLPEIRYTEENFTKEAFNLALASINRLVQCAERHHTLIAIEPGLNHPIYSVDKMAELIQLIDSDFMGVILDATNLITAENYLAQKEIVAEAFQRFGNKIIAIHLKDFIVVDDKIIPTNLGTGLMDMTGILEIISHHKPYINIVMEETKDKAIISARQLIQKEGQE